MLLTYNFNILRRIPNNAKRHINRCSENVAQLNKVLKSVTTSYDRHMEHLSAFAKHDFNINF